jgi:hypothetical protein
LNERLGRLTHGPPHDHTRRIPQHIGRTKPLKDHGPKALIEADAADEGRKKRRNCSSALTQQDAKFPSAPALPSNVAHQRRRKVAAFLRKQKG